METNYYLNSAITTISTPISTPAGSFAGYNYQTFTYPASATTYQPFLRVHDPAMVSMLEDLYPPTDSEIAARFGLDYLHPNTVSENE